MKRKLISFDVFKKIEGDSLSKAQHELVAVEEVLAKALNVDGLKLNFFNEERVTFQTLDGSYIHANYKIKNDNVVFENIEELVVEEKGERNKSKEYIASMIDALLDNNLNKANESFEAYLNAPVYLRTISEGFKVTVSKPTGKFSPLRHKKQSRSLVAKRIRAMMKTKRRQTPSMKATLDRKRSVASHKLGGSHNPRWRVYARKVEHATINDWAKLCANVLEYLDHKEFGPIANETLVKTDAEGNIEGLTFPTEHKRNEHKIISLDWGCLDANFKVLRGKMKTISEDVNFVKAMAELKRHHNVNDESRVMETVEKIVKVFPDLLALSQKELAENIHVALATANIKNYDDKVCLNLAENILKTAFNVFETSKVKHIVKLSGMPLNKDKDAFESFSDLSESLFAKLDESEALELKMFSDMVNSLSKIGKVAGSEGDELVKEQAEDFIKDCEEILSREREVNMQLAESIVEFIWNITEANLEGASNDWDVTEKPFISVNGDNPKMNWAAKQTNAVASNLTGDWGDSAPVSDGKSYKNGLADEMRGNAWGNFADSDTYPDLNNPYILKPFGDYKMKEKSAVDEEGLGEEGSGSSDTFPGLRNPFTPKEVKVPEVR